MSLLKLNRIIEQSNSFTYERVTRVVNGQKVTGREKVYKEECADGYKRDPASGRCVKMPPKEQLARSRAATKSANDPITKRNRATSMKRRSALVED